jgi:hypothetical protein
MMKITIIMAIAFALSVLTGCSPKWKCYTLELKEDFPTIDFVRENKKEKNCEIAYQECRQHEGGRTLINYPARTVIYYWIEKK